MNTKTRLTLLAGATLVLGVAGTLQAQDAPTKPEPLPAINAEDTALNPEKGRPERGGTGTLEIVTRPAGGEVYFADEYRGKSPLSVEVPSGRNDLSIDLDGWNLVRTRVNVWPDQKTTLNFELKLPLGAIRITTQPSKAEIRLDGKPIGRTQGAELNVGRVQAGKHELCAQAGAQSTCQSIEVPREDTLQVNLKVR